MHRVNHCWTGCITVLQHRRINQISTCMCIIIVLFIDLVKSSRQNRPTHCSFSPKKRLGNAMNKTIHAYAFVERVEIQCQVVENGPSEVKKNLPDLHKITRLFNAAVCSQDEKGETREGTKGHKTLLQGI